MGKLPGFVGFAGCFQVAAFAQACVVFASGFVFGWHFLYLCVFVRGVSCSTNVG